MGCTELPNPNRTIYGLCLRNPEPAVLDLHRYWFCTVSRYTLSLCVQSRVSTAFQSPRTANGERVGGRGV